MSPRTAYRTIAGSTFARPLPPSRPVPAPPYVTRRSRCCHNLSHSHSPFAVRTASHRAVRRYHHTPHRRVAGTAPLHRHTLLSIDHSPYITATPPCYTITNLPHHFARQYHIIRRSFAAVAVAVRTPAAIISHTPYFAAAIKLQHYHHTIICLSRSQPPYRICYISLCRGVPPGSPITFAHNPIPGLGG